MKNRFDLIIFDWDGTLVDSVDWIVHCMSKAAEAQELAIPRSQAIRNIVGLSIEKALDTLFPKLNKDVREALIVSYGDAFFSRQMTKNDLFADVTMMLQQFKKVGYKLAVATGKNRHELDKVMKGTALTDFFDMTRCADETASKPSPLMLNEIIKEMKVSKERVVMVGDSTHDMQMAINAGISSIAVLCGANTHQQMQQYNPLLNLQQTNELIEIL